MPNSNQIHVDKSLENISVAFKPEGLVAQEFSSTVPVKHESDAYFVYSKDNFRLENDKRAIGAEAQEVDFNLSTASYRLDEYAYRGKVPDRMRANADKAIRLDIETTEDLTGRIMIRREERLATLLQTTADWNTTSLTSTLAWSANTTLSNPIIQIDSAGSVIVQNASKMPNRLLLPYNSFLAAKEHFSLVDRIKHTSPESITKELMARLFNVDQVSVARGVRNTADENLADSMNFIWTDVVVLAWVEPSAGLRRVSGFYTFQQNRGGNPFRVRRWREEKLESDMIEVSSLYEHKAVASDAVFLIADTVQ